MQKKKTLLIIDMQAEFFSPPCTDKIVPVCSLIKMAKKHKWDIVNVLFDIDELHWKVEASSTKAYPQIEKLLYNYDKSETIIKSDCDGGREVVSHLQARKIDSQEIIVCGCYADQCVLETLTTIRKRLPKINITVVKKAVKACDYFPYGEYKKINAKVHMGTNISLTL